MTIEQELKLAESRAKVMKALGHPSRIFIVSHLSRKDASVGELADLLCIDNSTVSKHLSLLKQAGILIDRKDGNRVMYALICPCIMEFMHCIDDVILKDAEKGIRCVLPGAKISETG